MSLATGIAWCQSKMGLPYGIYHSRFGLSRPEHYDCSGFAYRYCQAAGTPLPAAAGTTTFTYTAYGQRNPNLQRSREFAMTHAGVLCLRGGTSPANSAGTNGHVVISDGHGGTYEAMGTAYGCRRGKIDGRAFTFFMVPPGYGGTGGAPAPPPDGSTDEEDRLAYLAWLATIAAFIAASWQLTEEEEAA